jgi:hypothetical protein
MNESFKTCPHCGTTWQTLEDFLNDPALELSGYQVHFVELENGLFYFTHHTERCGTTLAVPVQAFTTLTRRSFLAPCGHLAADGCSKLCVRGDTRTPCPAECECGWVREVMQEINHRKPQAND